MDRCAGPPASPAGLRSRVRGWGARSAGGGAALKGGRENGFCRATPGHRGGCRTACRDLSLSSACWCQPGRRELLIPLPGRSQRFAHFPHCSYNLV
ncbi:MAG: hypothetical protein EXS58_11440 [Candidatus Latescibacteria bacterium]|nr:hypothetical protein [Candidatus Latescibacterota bacterium]